MVSRWSTVFAAPTHTPAARDRVDGAQCGSPAKHLARKFAKTQVTSRTENRDAIRMPSSGAPQKVDGIHARVSLREMTGHPLDGQPADGVLCR